MKSKRNTSISSIAKREKSHFNSKRSICFLLERFVQLKMWWKMSRSRADALCLCLYVVILLLINEAPLNRSAVLCVPKFWPTTIVYIKMGYSEWTSWLEIGTGLEKNGLLKLNRTDAVACYYKKQNLGMSSILHQSISPKKFLMSF